MIALRARGSFASQKNDMLLRNMIYLLKGKYDRFD